VNVSHANKLTTIRASWEVCPKHRNVHREIPWPRQCHAGVKVFVLCCVEGRKTGQAIECRTWWHCVSAPQFPCVRSSAAEHRVANAEVRVRLPPSAPDPHGGRQFAQLSLQNSIRLGRHQHAGPVGDTCVVAARLPSCKQFVVGATPTVSTNSTPPG
jgi:hypothetical protein